MCQQPSLPQHPKPGRQTHAGCGIASVLWDSAASETLNDIMLTSVAAQMTAAPQSKPIQTIREVRALHCLLSDQFAPPLP